MELTTLCLCALVSIVFYLLNGNGLWPLWMTALSLFLKARCLCRIISRLGFLVSELRDLASRQIAYDVSSNFGENLEAARIFSNVMTIMITTRGWYNVAREVAYLSFNWLDSTELCSASGADEGAEENAAPATVLKRLWLITSMARRLYVASSELISMFQEFITSNGHCNASEVRSNSTQRSLPVLVLMSLLLSMIYSGFLHDILEFISWYVELTHFDVRQEENGISFDVQFRLADVPTGLIVILIPLSHLINIRPESRVADEIAIWSSETFNVNAVVDDTGVYLNIAALFPWTRTD